MWSNFNILNTTIDFFIKAKYPIIIDCSNILNALKTKVTFVTSRILHNFYKSVVGSSGATAGYPLILEDNVAMWTCPVLKAIQDTVEMQWKINNLAT